jgi:hypothetical protein
MCECGEGRTVVQFHFQNIDSFTGKSEAVGMQRSLRIEPLVGADNLIRHHDSLALAMRLVRKNGLFEGIDPRPC